MCSSTLIRQTRSSLSAFDIVVMFIMLYVFYVANNLCGSVQDNTLCVFAVATVAMSKAEKHDHAPNMAALQTYLTSFATGDLDKLIEVMVSFECALIQ